MLGIRATKNYKEFMIFIKADMLIGRIYFYDSSFIARKINS